MNCKIIFFLLCLLINLPSLLYAKLNLGAYTFAEAPAKALDIKTPLSKGLESLHFVNQIGGIAFDGVARGPAHNTFVSAVLDYNRSRRDGERLRIIFKDKQDVDHTVTARIYDWQLFPIVRFAHSDASACATSQGELIDQPLQKRHIQRGDWILNYHPAFQNSLLGLRLIQADFMAVIPEACDLPQSNGAYLLGQGELRPKVKSNRQKWDSFREAAQKFAQDYTAYVICDHESPVTFSASDRQLILTGEPVWCYVHCRKAVTDSVESLLRQEMNTRKKELYQKETGSPMLTSADFQTNARVCQELLKEFTEEYIENRRAVLLDGFPQTERLGILQPFSAKMTALIRQYRDMNPHVYDALTTTMRYTAFFRWIKRVSPSSLQILLDSYPYFDPVRELKTPSILVVSE